MLIGIGALFIALLGMGAAQAAFAVGIMYLMHKQIPDKLPEKTYGTFDFDAFEKLAFQNFLIRLAIIFVGSTLVLHMLEYVILYKGIVRHWGLVLSILFLLETTAIAVGLFKLFQLDILRLVILTSSSAIVYIFFQWLLKWSGLLI